MADQLKEVRTHCGRMDHGGCALKLEVAGNKIVSIKGDPGGYLNSGYSCAKGRASAQKSNHPNRLRHPLKRQGPRGSGNWLRISWDEALDEIAAGLIKIREEQGARAVAFGLGMPKGLEHFTQIRLANTFGSPNVVANQDVCHAPREVSGLHTCGFYPVADLQAKSELVVLWGSNITATNEEGCIASPLLEQLKGGTRLMVIDPRRTDLTSRAETWLKPRPGSDAALALGFLRVIITEGLFDKDFVAQYTHGFEELNQQVESFTPERTEELTWVPAGEMVRAARLYAAAKPAAIAWGNPLEHTVRAFEACRALICLMAVCGNLDAPGGNVAALEPRVAPAGKFVRADLIPDKFKTMLSAGKTIPRMMTIPPALFRQAVLENVPYSVRGYFSICANPMLCWADSNLTRQALEALDFLAVSEVAMTPTAALADIVLPAAGQFEMDDIGLYGLGHGLIQARPKVVEPPGEARPDMQIACDLGRLMTPEGLWPRDYHDLLADLLTPSGLDFSEFCELGYLKGPQRHYKYRDKGFRTPTGKVELILSKAQKFGLPPLPGYQSPLLADDPDFPLLLTGRKSRHFLHSSYRWLEALREKDSQPKATLHPDTAVGLGLVKGQQVRLSTAHGRVEMALALDDSLDPRLVYADYGWWFPEKTQDPLLGWQESNYNFLTSAALLGNEFGTPNLKAIPCKLEKAEE